MSSQYCELRPTKGWDLFVSLGHLCKFQRVLRLGIVTARYCSSGRQPNFAALNRGRHLYSAGRPSCWALAHILVFLYFLPFCSVNCVCIYTRDKKKLLAIWLSRADSILEAEYILIIGRVAEIRTTMWANAQRDGRPAEYGWRPLFNAAKFGWRPLLECRAVTKPRRETRWNLHGCPKQPNRSQPLVGRSSPYCEDMWGRYCCLINFFQLSIRALVVKI